MACPTFRCTVNKVEKIADLAVLNFGAFAERNKKRKNQERRILSRKTLTRFLSYIRIRSIQYKERLILKKKTRQNDGRHRWRCSPSKTFYGVNIFQKNQSGRHNPDPNPGQEQIDTFLISDVPNMVRSMDPTHDLQMGVHSGTDSPIYASHRSQAGMIHLSQMNPVVNLNSCRAGILSHTPWQFIT